VVSLITSEADEEYAASRKRALEGSDGSDTTLPELDDIPISKKHKDAKAPSPSPGPSRKRVKTVAAQAAAGALAAASTSQQRLRKWPQDFPVRDIETIVKAFQAGNKQSGPKCEYIAKKLDNVHTSKSTVDDLFRYWHDWQESTESEVFAAWIAQNRTASYKELYKLFFTADHRKKLCRREHSE
jgi:hypothetical protein